MQLTDSHITLKGLQFYAYHGVFPQENKVGGHYTVDLEVHYDASKAMTTDNVDDAVNYAHLYNIIKEEMYITSHLIEHVAYRIAQHISDAFSNITNITVTLIKCTPPMGADTKGASITLHFNCQQ